MVDLNGIKLKNRFLVASGALEYGRGWPWERPLIKLGLIDPRVFGAVVTKTLTLEPRQGNYIDPFAFEKCDTKVICHILSHISDHRRVLRKIPGGWLNNFGWWNVGIDYYIAEIYPQTKDITIIVSIGGCIIEDYLKLIKKLNSLDIAAIEINISCPNVENPLAKNIDDLAKLFAKARKESQHPLIIKLGVDCDYIQIAKLAEYFKINAISAINSVPVLGGGYSGSGIKYIALKVISDLKKNTSLPVIGGGGIYSWKDCKKFFETGADAVSFGSVHFLQPWKPTWIVRRHARLYPKGEGKVNGETKEVEKWIKDRF